MTHFKGLTSSLAKSLAKGIAKGLAKWFKKYTLKKQYKDGGAVATTLYIYYRLY